LANGTRWTMSHGRLFAAYGLAAIGLFIGCFGIGLWNAGALAIGAAVGVFGPAMLLVSSMRSNTRQFIFGTAHVHEASPPPSSGMIGRAELHLSVYAEGIDGVAVRVLDPAVPVSKWPDDGAQLPVEVDAKNPRRVRVLWDKVVTHAQAAGEDLYPGFGTSDGGVAHDDLEEDYLGSPYDEFGGTDAMTDLPPVPPAPPGSPAPPTHPARPTSPSAQPAAPASPAATSAPAQAAPPPRSPVSAQAPAAPTGPSLIKTIAPNDPGVDAAERERIEQAPPPASPAPTGPATPPTQRDSPVSPAPTGPAPEARIDEPVTTNGNDRPPISPVYIEDDSLNETPNWLVTDYGDVPERPESRPEPDDTEVVTGTIVEGDAISGGSISGDSMTDTVVTGTVERGRHRSPGHADRSETDLVGFRRPVLRLIKSDAIDVDDPDIIDAEVVEPGSFPSEPSRFLSAPSAGVAEPGSADGVDITLQVRDLDRSVEFYRDIVGFYEIEIDDYADTAILARGDAEILLHEVADPDPVDLRVVHLNLEVPDVYSAHDDLRAKGVEFVHSPRVVSRGDQLELWAATFRDPDDHAIALTRWELRR
jgi:catechol 2,3-dioxygenase-like lactoylglutathione lyase family enzyme